MSVQSDQQEQAPPNSAMKPNILECQVSSMRVQQIASSFYAELDQLSSAHGSPAIEALIPLVIRTLETMDDMHRDLTLYQKESEQLKEDYTHCLDELERERNLRKQSDNKFLSLEDSFEDERRKYKDDAKKLTTAQKQSDIEMKQLQDHISRLEERLSEVKKDNSKLQNRINELIQGNADLHDKVKVLQCEEASTAAAVVKPSFRKKSNNLFSESGDLGGFDEMPDVGDLNLTEEDLPEQSLNDLDHGAASHRANATGDVITDETAGAHNEIQKLVKEYIELQETKDALSIVKDDLLMQVDNLNNENMHLQESLREMTDAKDSLHDRLRSAEQHLSLLRGDLQDTKQALQTKLEEEKNPINQKKRFTSAELHQVITERNRFKKDLLELEDAVRLAEMARVNSRMGEFASLHGRELKDALRSVADAYPKPVSKVLHQQSVESGATPGLATLAKFFGMSLGRSRASIADTNDSASACSGDSPVHRPPRSSSSHVRPHFSWLSLNGTKAYAPVYGWTHLHNTELAELDSITQTYPIPVQCRQIETVDMTASTGNAPVSSPNLGKRSSSLSKAISPRTGRLEQRQAFIITVGVALTEGFKTPHIWLAGRGEGSLPPPGSGQTGMPSPAQVYIFDILQMAKPICQFELPTNFIPMTGARFDCGGQEVAQFPQQLNNSSSESADDASISFTDVNFDVKMASDQALPIGVVIGSNDGHFLMYKMSPELPTKNVPFAPPTLVGRFKLRERGQTANEITALGSNILMAISSPCGKTRVIVLRWSPAYLVPLDASNPEASLPQLLTWGPLSVHSLPAEGDGAGPIILAKNFTSSGCLWMGTVGGGLVHCFSGTAGDFQDAPISLPESSICMHALDCASQPDGEFLLAAVSGPRTMTTVSCETGSEVFEHDAASSAWATSVARIVRISLEQRGVVQIFDLTDAITRSVDIANVTDPVDLTVCRLLMSQDNWVWFITRSGLIGRLHYAEYLLNSDSVLVPCPDECIYLSCHGFRRALVAALWKFDRVSTFGPHVLAIGHDYVDLRPSSSRVGSPYHQPDVIRSQPADSVSFNSRRSSANAHAIMWRLS